MAVNRALLQSLTNLDVVLHEVYENEYKDPEIDISKVFSVMGSDSAQEVDLTTHGVTALEEVGEGGTVPYDDPGEGYKTYYRYRVFKKGVTITEEMRDDNEYRQMANMMTNLAERASYDPVDYAYGVLRNGFSANPSGYANYNSGAVALISASQTYEDGRSGNQSNILATADTLSYDAYEKADIALAEQKTGHGTLLEYPGKRKLVVPPTLKREAIEITNSEQDPDTAENAVSVYKGTADVVVVPYMAAAGTTAGSDTAWFVCAPGNKLNFFWRTKPTFDKEVDFDTDVLKYKVVAKYIAGFSDWRGIVGSAGA